MQRVTCSYMKNETKAALNSAATIFNESLEEV